MSINSAQATNIKAQITTIDAQLDAANTTYTNILAEEIESYKFDSREGSQQAKRRKLEDLDTIIIRLGIRRDHLIQKLNCSGVTNLKLSRRG